MESHESIFMGLPTAAFVLDGSGLVTHWNPAAGALIGRGDEHAVGKTLQEVLGLAGAPPAIDGALLHQQAGSCTVRAETHTLQIDCRPTADGAVGTLQAVDCGLRRHRDVVEGISVAIVTTDTDLRITYVNPAAAEMMRKYEPQFRQQFSGFRADQLIGQAMNIFQGNSHNQREALSDLGRLPQTLSLNIGGLDFDVVVSALVGAHGEWVGNTCEWIDCNARSAYRREVERLSEAARHGDLSARGDLGRVDEVYAPMLSSINELIELIIAPIGELQDRLAQLASGDLTAYIDTEYSGDHGQLKDALNTTLDAFNQILGQVQGASERIASGSGEVSSSSHLLSLGATKQAAAVEEISASISEMADKIRVTADNASQASELAERAGEIAQVGDGRMRLMVDAMVAIEESSNSISKIIKVIDEIAFQTNLLALNAAVEAARAGAHGKGFAVVAEEVRNLAARSANAARETTAMIEESIKKVGQGTSIANETAASLEQIVASVQQVCGLVAEIAQASGEQAQGIAHVDIGLRQVDQVTQQNTAGAEESAAAAEELSSQAALLREQLSRFTIQERAGGSDVVGELSPELLAAVQAYLTQQGGAQAASGAAMAGGDSEFGRY